MEITVGICPFCKNELVKNFSKGSVRDVMEVVRWEQCPTCGKNMPNYYRVPEYPSTIRHTYMSFLLFPMEKPLESILPYSDLLFFVASEAYIWLRGEKYNGFITVANTDNIPSITKVSVPSTTRIFRSDFPPDLLFVLCSIITSGIIGNFSYDVLKTMALAIWSKIKRSSQREQELILNVSDKYIHIQTNDERAMLLAIDAIYDYCVHRLNGVSNLVLTDTPLGRVFSLLKERQIWSSKEIAERAGISKSQAIELLKVLGASYNTTGVNKTLWTIDANLLS